MLLPLHSLTKGQQICKFENRRFKCIFCIIFEQIPEHLIRTHIGRFLQFRLRFCYHGNYLIFYQIHDIDQIVHVRHAGNAGFFQFKFMLCRLIDPL
ncbi:MAG: type II toxin-antitoxin system RelE/ParE family toxin [Clostridia bacterium]|nr:type II toxin-antitoxin system RelE/ParE family toxin [Clostridia bacterium]